MNLFELAVIYLAFGAPLGVYHAATHWGEPAASIFPVSLLSVFLWPLASLFLLYVYLTRPYLRGSEPAHIAERLCGVANSDLPAEAAFEFREVASRYIGLCEALNREIGTSFVDGLAMITGSEHSAAAKACAARVNRQRLQRHLTDARRDLKATSDRLGYTHLAAELAASLSDHEAVHELNAGQALISENPSERHISLAA